MSSVNKSSSKSIDNKKSLSSQASTNKQKSITSTVGKLRKTPLPKSVYIGICLISFIGSAFTGIKIINL
jgi:hypothetical protein|uniref:Uncharacterized protein n=1 Tax=viral metagenome TaxID=1070528 RepID=A0A6C0H082_9ZZZZ